MIGDHTYASSRIGLGNSIAEAGAHSLGETYNSYRLLVAGGRGRILLSMFFKMSMIYNSLIVSGLAKWLRITCGLVWVVADRHPPKCISLDCMSSFDLPGANR